jgi:hypothetical protein
MKKTFFITTLVFLVSVSFAFIKDKPPRYDNLKVLPKNTDKHQMDSVMRHFSAALGVNCTFCHVRETEGQKNFDFASDNNKHKIISRDMFKMMTKINKKYFKEDNENNVNRIPEVSCYTCHNGKKHPQNKPSTNEPGKN